MKKFVSALLTVCMLASIMLSMASCSLFKKKIELGTEAAKLLLANERLDEKLVGSKINIGMFGGAKEAASAEQSKSMNATLASYPSAPGSASQSKAASAALASSSSVTAVSATGHTRSSFPAASSSMVEFSQFMESVELQGTRIAENIAHMKNNVGVTDKWVKVGLDRQMLRVFENYDVLIIQDYYNDIHVCYRYTDENAKNVYEMFSYMSSYADGTTGEIRTMFIPGERYEYMYNDSNGYTDYFIAENSRGYWMNTRFNYFADEDTGFKTASFSPYIVKDGLGFGSFLDLDNSGGLTNLWYSVFDPEGDRELFRITNRDGDYQFDLYMSAIRNGFVSASATEFRFDDEYNVYETDMLNTLTTRNGVYTAIFDHEQLPKNQFAFNSGYVQCFRGDNIYYGSLDFVMAEPQMTLDQACTEFSDYASSLGLDLYCNMETVAASLEHALLLSDGFGESFWWNGYKMSSIENIEKARDVLQSQFDDARADYEEVKNYETVNTRQTLSKDAHFAELETAAVGGNSFDGTSVILSGVSVLTSDVALFEVGKEYVLKVGLSRLDENGNPSSVNTVALSGAEPASVLFNGGSITLGASGSYEIPKNLDSGNYAAVVYIATKDDGIRVSEIEKIAFLSIDEGEIESSAMYIEAIEQNDNLILKYEIKNKRSITLTATKSAYSYDEIKRAITLEILAYGAPYHGAVLEYENGKAVDEGASLGKGTYRMVCYLATSDGLAQSYVYLTVE